MCITIPSSARSDRNPNPGHRAWRGLSDSPLRLLSTGGVIALGPLLLTVGSPGSVVPLWFWFNLLFGVVPLFLFAGLLQVLPIRTGGTPVRYTRYALVCFLLCGAQLAWHLSAWWGDGPGPLYLLLLLGGWHLGIVSLQGILRLIPDNRLGVLRWLPPLLKLALLALLVVVPGLLFGRLDLAGYGVSGSSVLVVLSLLTLLPRSLVSQAP